MSCAPPTNHTQMLDLRLRTAIERGRHARTLQEIARCALSDALRERANWGG